MNTLFFGLITLAVLAAAGVFVLVMIELRNATRSLNDFIRTTDQTVKPTMEEIQLTLRSLRQVTDNVTAVTDDVRVLSASVREVGDNIRHVSDVIDEVTTSTSAKVLGLRAGVKAATEVIVKSLASGRHR